MSNAYPLSDAITKLNDALTDFLCRETNGNIRVSDLRRLSGGASHDTWAFDAFNGEHQYKLVLRRDFPAPLVRGDITAEYNLLRSLDRLGFPVASARYCDANGLSLGTPSMVVDRIDGLDLRKALAGGLDVGVRKKLAYDIIALQVSIHKLERKSFQFLPCGGIVGEVNNWAKIVNSERVFRPLLVATHGWLLDNLPEIETSSLVHGDFKANNLLIDAENRLTVIDWEMAHCGDPIEDLAWTLLWTTTDDLVGGLITREAYLRTYVELAGEQVDQTRLLFWEIFALFKLAGIFISGTSDKPDVPLRPTYLQLHRALPWLEAKLARKLASNSILAELQ